MYIELTGEEIKNLMMFVSKDKTRYVMQGVSIKTLGDDVEFAATDGCGLYLIRRKLKENETGPREPLIVAFPKLKYKTVAFLEDMPEYNRACRISTPQGEQGLATIIDATFPNYNAVLPAKMDDVPYATEYAAFTCKKLKMLEAVFPAGLAQRPRAKNAGSAHYWQEERAGGRLHTVVIMPCVAK